MALNIPMPESPGTSFLQGIDTGSSMLSRLMQPVLERERLKQQQTQFVQDYALKKQAQDKTNALLPYMIQQYQDTHRTSASEADMKDIYRNLLKDALADSGGQSGAPNVGGMPPQRSMPSQGQVPLQIGAAPNAAPSLPDVNGGVITSPMTSNTAFAEQEHELRAGNPRLAKLDSVAGLVPGVPKAATHYSNGMIFTTYPSGRMTVQQMNLPAAKSPGEKTVSAKEASKIRDQATALANSANLVNQGYGLLDNNPDLTGIGSGLASKFNLSNNPELGKFTTVTGKLQAELGKYASSRGGIQAVNWAANVKPSQWKPEDYNYGMFEGIQQNLQDDYNTLNQQYRAATGQDLPIPLPKMTTARGKKGTETGTAGNSESGKGKVTKWKMTGGQLVKE